MKRDSKRTDILKGTLTPDMSFDEKVWAICARIPQGSVVTYGQIARALQSRGYRAVGAALGRNPYAPQVPCHRVVAADGKLTGYSAQGGVHRKREMLIQEGIGFRGQRVAMAQHQAARLTPA